MSLFEFFMENYKSDDLKEWVDLCGGSSQITRKSDRANFLVKTLTSATEVRRLWDKMDDLSRKVVAAAYHNDGQFNRDAFVAQYGSLPLRPRHSRWSGRSQKILMDIFIQGDAILPAIMPHLASFVPPPERFQLEGIEAEALTIQIDGAQTACTIAQREEAGRRDLLTFLSIMNQRSIKLNNTSLRLTPKSVELLRQQLVVGDFVADAATADETILCFGLTVFAHGAGLIDASGKLTETGARYLTTEDPALLLDAFEHWSEHGGFDEVTRIRALKGLRARNVRLTLPAERNQRIVEALSWCPAGVWLSVADFYRAIKIWHFDFDIEQGGIEKLYVGYGDYERYGVWASAQDQWLLTTGLYINAILWEILASIGALDIAHVEAEKRVFTAEVATYD